MFIHGGAYMLGNSRMNSNLQITDCLSRGWIVVAPNHRLCPQVDVLEGPISDCRRLWQWIHAGNLDALLGEHGHKITVDRSRMVVIGTSAGGMIAYSLAFADQPNPPLAILDFYGSKDPRNSFWSETLPFIPAPPMQADTIDRVLAETPTATKHSVSLEGQKSDSLPDARFTWAMNLIKTARLWPTIYPRAVTDPSTYALIDSMQNVHPKHPPTCIIHGDADKMVPLSISQGQYDLLQANGIESELIVVPGEGHTFAGKMEKGSRTYEIQRQGFDWLERKIQEV
jgi:acetyl esterase/lipase